MQKTLLLTTLFLLTLISCTKDFGTTEVTFTRATAIYGDLDEIRSTPLIANTASIVNPGKVYLGEYHLLIGEEDKGIHVYDNSNPASPRPLYFLNVPGNKEFFVENDVIYAESIYDLVKIDITDIANPRLISRVENYSNFWHADEAGDVVIGFNYERVTMEIDDNDENFWNEYHNYSAVFYDYRFHVIPHSAVPVSFAGNGQSIGSVNRIAKAKDHVYMINNERMFIFSDDGDLSFVTEMHVVPFMETVYPQGDQLFIGARTSVTVMDISNAGDPSILGSFFHGEACDPVYPYEQAAYVTLRSGDDDICPGEESALVTLDISRLFNPVQVNEIEMESPYGLLPLGDRLFVGEGTSGLKIFDIEDRFNPSLLTWNTDVNAYDIIPHPTLESVILVAEPDGFGQYELDQALNLTPISKINY